MHERQVLITGAGGGLGREVTAAALRAGARVTAATFGDDAQALREHLDAEAFSRVHTVDVDVTEPDQVEALVAGMPKIDVLLHLVGGFAMGPTASFDFAAYQRLIALNLTSTFCAVRSALGRMQAAGYGRIVTVASRNALAPSAQTAVYGATKAAVLALTQSVADETRDQDITANAVLPSIIDTPANRAAMGAEQADRWVSPASLAKSIVFLGSEAAGDLRGTALRVYGGA